MAKKKKVPSKPAAKKKTSRARKARASSAPKKRRAAARAPSAPQKRRKKRRTHRNPDMKGVGHLAAAVGAGFVGFVLPAVTSVAAAPAGQPVNPTVDMVLSGLIAAAGGVAVAMLRPGGAAAAAATGAAVGGALRLAGTHAAQRSQAAIISARNTLPAAPAPAQLPQGTTISAVIDGQMRSVVMSPEDMAAIARAY